MQANTSYGAWGPFGASVAGVLPGETRFASRHAADASIDNINVSKWATKQAREFEHETTSFAKQVEVARCLNDLGGDTKGLPVCFLNGKLTNFEGFKCFLSQYNEILVPLVERSYDESMYAMTIVEIPSNFFVNSVKPQVGVFDVKDRGFQFEKDLISRLKVSEGRRLALSDAIATGFWSSFSTDRVAPNGRLRRQITDIWGSSISFEICRAEIYSPPVRDIASERWVVRVSKDEV